MGISCKTGYISLNTSTGTQAITGVGFQPKFILFLGTRNTSSGTVTDIQSVLGFATSNSAMSCLTMQCNNGVTTTDTQRAWLNYAFQQYDRVASTVLYRAFLNSMDTDGFTIDLTVAPSSAFRVGYIAFGGTDITNTAIGSVSTATGTGTQSITGLGFQPDFILAVSAGDNRAASSRASNIEGMWCGFAAGTGSTDQVSLALSDTDNLTTSVTRSNLNIGRFITVTQQDGTPSLAATLSSFDSDGFTINKLVSSSIDLFIYIAVKGGKWHVDSFTARSSTGNFNVTDTNFTPKGLFCISGCHPPTTSALASLGYSTGFASSSTDQFTQGGFSEDSVTTTNSFNFNEIDEIYISHVYNGIFGSMSLVSFLSNGFTLNQTDPEVEWQNEIAYFAVGEEGLPIWVNVNGVWKQVTDVSVNKEGTWKTVSSVSVDTAGTWKSVV